MPPTKFTFIGTGNNDKERRRKEGKRKRASHCCCGLRCTCVLLACVELLILTYQLIVTILDILAPDHTDQDDFRFLSKTSVNDDYTSLITLPLILLAITVVVVALFGIILRVPYLLIPHLLMQLIFFIFTAFLACCLAFWWAKGVNLQFSAIFFEASREGETGLNDAEQRSPIEAHLTVTEMEYIAVALTTLFALLLIFQLLFIILILATFLQLRGESKFHPRNNVKASVDGSEKCSTALTMFGSVYTGVSPSATTQHSTSQNSNLSLNNIQPPAPQRQQLPQLQQKAPSPRRICAVSQPMVNFGRSRSPSPSVMPVPVAPVAPIMAHPAPPQPPTPQHYTNTTTVITDTETGGSTREVETALSG